MISTEIKVLSWNCTGAKSKPLHIYFGDIIQIHNPTILVLLETKVHSSICIDDILKLSTLNKFVCAEVQSFVSEIWCLWNDSHIDLDIAYVDEQVITAIIRDQAKVGWVLSMVYASPNPLIRYEL